MVNHRRWFTGVDAINMALTGLLGGTIQISMRTWPQRRVPQALVGRTRSIVMFTFLGMAPRAAALAGSLLKVLSLCGIALFSLTCPSMRAIRLAPAGD